MPARNKFTIAALLSTFYFLLFTTPVFAQSASVSATQQLSYQQSQTPVSTDLLVANIFHTFGCLSIGQSLIGQPCLNYRFIEDIQGKPFISPFLSSVNTGGGALGTATGFLAGLYTNPPVRISSYLADVGEGFGFAHPVHAQVGGSGAAVLGDPVLKLWQVSRNISYVFMIIVFLVIGLMVMFRQRINPQTVITAQAAIPGLIIGLVMITFSYFLAALLIDTAFIGTNLVGYYFSAAQGAPAGNLLDRAKDENVLTIMSRFIGSTGPDNFTAGVKTVFGNVEGFAHIVLQVATSFVAYQYGSQIGGPLGSVLAGGGCLLSGVGAITLPICAAIGNIVGSLTVGTGTALVALASPEKVISIAIYVLLLAILIYVMFRLIFRLINSYLTIIFLTITAPFHFLAASLPGRQGIATDWVRNMFCNVLAFPAVFAVFYFSAYLLGDSSGVVANSTLFGTTGTLNLAGTQTLPLLGGLDLSFIRFLLAFGALMAAPSIPDILCRTIGKPGAAGQMIEQEISKAQGGGQKYLGQAAQAPGVIGKDLEKAQQLRTRWEPTMDEDGKISWRISPSLPLQARIHQQHPPLPKPYGPGRGAPGPGGPAGGGPGGAPGPGGPAGPST